jgi:L-2-hydroxyglutarate oxidase LhgO
LEDIETVIIGAGVVGLAIAQALSKHGQEVIVIEGEASFAQHTSSRNSEVIHAGLHYPPNSLKAKLCVRGKELLYQYCAQNHIDHQKIGKITVATSVEETTILHRIMQNSEASGVNDTYFLTLDEIKEMEPELEVVAGVFSPSTGIVDSHGLMLSLIGKSEEAKAMFAYNSPFLGAIIKDDHFIIEVGGGDPIKLRAKNLINCAGLNATKVAHSIQGLDKSNIPTPAYAKGNYFTYSGKAPFKHLIYPVPIIGGLGIHYTRDTNDQVRFGPDVEWVDEPSYLVSENRFGEFVASIRRYWPNLNTEKLIPGYAGVRPKIEPKEVFSDFIISGPKSHEINGLYNLFGIDSPGLTSSLAIGEYISGLMKS